MTQTSAKLTVRQICTSNACSGPKEALKVALTLSRRARKYRRTSFVVSLYDAGVYCRCSTTGLCQRRMPNCEYQGRLGPWHSKGCYSSVTRDRAYKRHACRLAQRRRTSTVTHEVPLRLRTAQVRIFKGHANRFLSFSFVISMCKIMMV